MSDGGRVLSNVVVVALGRARCPACENGRLGDGRACPRCHGDGLEPFPADPTCGHEGCECDGPLTFLGHADNAGQQPVYECSNGRHTCVHYTDPDIDTTTVAVDGGQIGWAILELDGGRRQLGGYVSEAVIAGVPCLRIQVPIGQERSCTMIFNAHSLYCLTPTSEEVATAVACGQRAQASDAGELQRGHAEARPSAPPPEPRKGRRR